MVEWGYEGQAKLAECFDADGGVDFGGGSGAFGETDGGASGCDGEVSR